LAPERPVSVSHSGQHEQFQGVLGWVRLQSHDQKAVAAGQRQHVRIVALFCDRARL